jgi:DNA-binding NarL/FixJ family response regulator
MRIFLVGSVTERDQLRGKLPASLEIAAEFTTLGAARRTSLRADAVVVLPTDREASLSESEPLTAREIEVLEQLSEGLSNKAIGARLGISDQTVKFHVATICGKLGAANRTDAVRRAISSGLVAV